MSYNRSYVATSLALSPAFYLRVVHLGWDDFMHGRPWCGFYDDMNEQEQVAYEQGRLCAVNSRAAGYDFDWDGSREGALIIERLHATACYKVGSPFPVARVAA